MGGVPPDLRLERDFEGFLGWKGKIRENNSEPKEKNVRKDCAPKAPENFGF